MSFAAYPPDRYTGPEGEAGSGARPASGAPELSSPSVTTTHSLATGARTGATSAGTGGAGDRAGPLQGPAASSRVVGGRRAVSTFTPGAPREDYFETPADPARWEAMDDVARAAFFLRHDTVWTDEG